MPVRAFFVLAAALFLGAAVPCSAMPAEVRGTWITTTANDALRTPADTAATMRRLKDIGINTVYVEAWKNGYTQFPSNVLQRTVGVRQRPSAALQDPGDSAARSLPARDLLQESLIEAHRNGLIYVAWFEYGFMAAHKSTMNHLRLQKGAWLSRDIHGSEIAPNGFVWLNPLHPEAQAFLLDLVLEAVDKYDIDGVQLDDRIVWPHVTMGYDDYTQQVYAREHGGRRPPANHADPEWMAWRAAKVSEFAKRFVQEVRTRRPGLLVSLSPAVYPWSWENYLLAWPEWSAWSEADRVTGGAFRDLRSAAATPRWDEFIPQAYRFSYEAFESTWRQQVAAVKKLGGDRQRALVAGIRIVGDGADSSWEQLRRSIMLTRQLGNGGHVLWYSRGVLDLYAEQLKALYAESGPAVSPHFGAGWREASIALSKARGGKGTRGYSAWRLPKADGKRYRLIGFAGMRWEYLGELASGQRAARLPARFQEVELVFDRRGEAP